MSLRVDYRITGTQSISKVYPVIVAANLFHIKANFRTLLTTFDLKLKNSGTHKKPP